MKYSYTTKKSELPHYYVKDVLFITWGDAEAYCDLYQLPYNLIKKSYYYK